MTILRPISISVLVGALALASSASAQISLTPPVAAEPPAAALPAHLVRFERFANCRHAVVPDARERAIALMRDFIVA